MPKIIWFAPFLFLAASPKLPEVTPQTLFWAAPGILLAALVIAWAAESAQFFISQGFALAILAWMQTLPEFAVEVVLAWHRQIPFLLAGLTGALRLLTGLGWPMIYCAAALAYRKREGKPMERIALDGQHSIQIIGLIPPIAYMLFVWWKGSLHLADAVVLTLIYAAYLMLLSKMPPEDAEGMDDLERIPRAIVCSPRGRRIALIGGLFVLGGAIIYFTAEPFLGSLFAVSVRVGIPSFVFIQWVAPFVSEFPEGLSTYYWARSVRRAPMALMNMISSNINQWTLLVAVLPVVVSFSAGTVSSVPFDEEQKVELLMTIGQQLVGILFLVNMELVWWEATALFGLWFVQFAFSAIPPSDSFLGTISDHMHWWMTIAYFIWAGWEFLCILFGRRKPRAFTDFGALWRQYVHP
jgi:cation:H+ antiporter